MGIMKILVVEPLDVFGELLCDYLEKSQNANTYHARDGVEMRNLVIEKRTNFDLIMVDPGSEGIDGIYDLGKIIEASSKDARIVLFATDVSKVIVSEFVKMGGKGLLQKTMPLEKLNAAIKFVSSGNVYLPLEGMIKKKYSKNFVASGITEEEHLILELLSKGKSNKELSRILNYSIVHIKNSVRALCAKLQVENRTQLAVYFVKNFS